jgi:hypothetical protein
MQAIVHGDNESRTAASAIREGDAHGSIQGLPSTRFDTMMMPFNCSCRNKN